MSENIYASLIKLSPKDLYKYKITDPYSIHKIVYDFHDDIRDDNDKRSNISSEILFSDEGFDKKTNEKKILIISSRPTRKSEKYNNLNITTKTIPNNFFDFKKYNFKIKVNPTIKRNGKNIPITKKEDICSWFLKKQEQMGVYFSNLEVRDITILNFKDKKQRNITLSCALIVGQIEIIDKKRFKECFISGIGRGKAFGLGLLQAFPLNQ